MPITIDYMCIVIGTPSNGASSSANALTAALCGISKTGEGTSVDFRTASISDSRIADAISRIHIFLIGY